MTRFANIEAIKTRRAQEMEAHARQQQQMKEE